MPAASRDSTGDIVKLWMQTAKVLGKRIFLQTGKTPVNPQQMFAMFIISEHTGITMKELARELGITSPSATSLVNRLVRMKWVTRVSDPQNRRLVRLTMALAGRKILESAMQARAKAMHEVLSLLPVEDRKDFARILSHLHSVLTSPTRQ
jgi:DNA-binding MarR family transcriptional regulator